MWGVVWGGREREIVCVCVCVTVCVCVFLCAYPDTCYILSFSIIMLNTSLHNPNVKDKPPVERFISMNRGIDHGGDLPQELLMVCVCVWVCHLPNTHCEPNNKFRLFITFCEDY